jgi:hypothetical protein
VKLAGDKLQFIPEYFGVALSRHDAHKPVHSAVEREM